MTDYQWAKLSDRERDAKVAEALELPFLLTSLRFGTLKWTTYPTRDDAQVAANALNKLYAYMTTLKWEPEPLDEKLTSTGNGMMVVIAGMMKRRRGYQLTLAVQDDWSTAIWRRGADMFRVCIQGPPDKAAPSANALAAVRALSQAKPDSPPP